ncbi:retrovirus-related pol polyprotein from transposon TNT 1-94 [Tanacetum coccineum]
MDFIIFSPLSFPRQYRRIRCCQDSKSVLSSIGGRVSELAHWMSSCILDILYYYDMICFDRSMISECTLKVDIQDSPDDEDDTRSSHEYLNDLEEEYQARALLAKSKMFFKKGTQNFSNAKATAQTECHKCGKKGHFVRDCWLKTSVPSYQSPFQSKLILSSENKPELRQIKDFEAKYHKVKAKLALLSSSASAPSSSSGKNKGLIAETYD